MGHKKDKDGKKDGGADGSRTYKLIELVGTSSKSYEDAIQSAVTDASKTVKGLSWFETIELRGHVIDGKVSEYQAKIRVAFRVLN